MLLGWDQQGNLCGDQGAWGIMVSGVWTKAATWHAFACAWCGLLDMLAGQPSAHTGTYQRWGMAVHGWLLYGGNLHHHSTTCLAITCLAITGYESAIG